MNRKHTPGPWAVSSERPVFGCWHVRQDPPNWTGGGYQAICSLPAERKGNHYGDMFAANARLIASAPALLAALESAEYAVNVTRACLMDSVETHGTHGGWLHGEAMRLDSELDLIRAAIAKATDA